MALRSLTVLTLLPLLACGSPELESNGLNQARGDDSDDDDDDDELEISLLLFDRQFTPFRMTTFAAGFSVTLKEAEFDNFAYCLARLGAFCVDEYPDPGEEIRRLSEFDPFSVPLFNPGGIETSGFDIDFLEPFSVGFGSSDTPFASPPDLTITGGLVGDGFVADAYDVAGQPTLLSPDPLGDTPQIRKGDNLTLEFSSEGPGTNHLQVFAPDSRFILGLPDSGTLDFDIERLEVEEPLFRLLVELQRNLFDDFEVNDTDGLAHTLRIQELIVEYLDPTGLTELSAGVGLAEDCSDADSLPTVEAGEYFGNLRGFTNELEIEVEGNTLGTGEAVLKLELDAGQSLDVQYRTTIFSSGQYLLQGTCDVQNLVASAIDTAPFIPLGSSSPSNLTFTNTSATTQTYFLVLDAQSKVAETDLGFFTASISIQ